MRKLTKDELAITKLDIRQEIEDMGAYSPWRVSTKARILRDRIDDLYKHIEALENENA